MTLKVQGLTKFEIEQLMREYWLLKHESMLLSLTGKWTKIKTQRKDYFISFWQKLRTPKITEKCSPRMNITISLK